MRVWLGGLGQRPGPESSWLAAARSRRPQMMPILTLAAVVGLLSGPLVIVVGLALAYTKIGWSSAIHGVLDGKAPL